MFFVMILAVIFLWTKETMIRKLVSVADGLMHDYILLLKILSCVYRVIFISYRPEARVIRQNINPK